ncbi:hypothetical protein BAE44_0021172 [Dichanthelium oligosanthes]|uniref:Protein TIFY n=1 Tax=Dichanthelium oligosanthes TaxID=888268 RepID=A0A1E5UY49_9POAL|nr:hypothetical protein BAE44_0021172 [Dichanthelium oligosanthes]
MAAAAPASGGTGSTWAATTRFAAACGALSQYVKAAEAERAHARPAVPVRPLPLMPGADVDVQDPAEAGAAPAQMTIVYGERVMTLDDVPADKAASLLRLATVAARGGAVEPQTTTGRVSAAAADLPVARKASLERFMEKRKGRVAARGAPYRRPDGSDACPDDEHLKLAL